MYIVIIHKKQQKKNTEKRKADKKRIFEQTVLMVPFSWEFSFFISCDREEE